MFETFENPKFDDLGRLRGSFTRFSKFSSFTSKSCINYTEHTQVSPGNDLLKDDYFFAVSCSNTVYRTNYTNI